MSRENMELIAGMLARVQADPSALAQILDEDAVFDVGAFSPDGAVPFRGPAGVRDFFRSWIGAFEDWGFRTVELIDAGDSVVVEIDQWGRGKGSGAAVHQLFWQVWTLRDGRVVSVTHHTEKSEALAAAGGSSSD